MRDTTLNVKCGHCKTWFPLAVDADDIARWKAGEYVQNVLHYLTAGERELLISGTCDECWVGIMGDWDD